MDRDRFQLDRDGVQEQVRVNWARRFVSTREGNLLISREAMKIVKESIFDRFC
jgi:hypothetical protein